MTELGLLKDGLAKARRLPAQGAHAWWPDPCRTGERGGDSARGTES
jgi:hypothetical protein